MTTDITLLGILAQGKHAKEALRSYAGKAKIYPVHLGFAKKGYVLFYFAVDGKKVINILESHQVDMIKEIVLDRTKKEAQKVMLDYTYREDREENGSWLANNELSLGDLITTKKVIDDFEILYKI